MMVKNKKTLTREEELDKIVQEELDRIGIKSRGKDELSQLAAGFTMMIAAQE